MPCGVASLQEPPYEPLESRCPADRNNFRLRGICRFPGVFAPGRLWQWPLALFALQLVLNAAWSWLFFGLHLPGWAFVEVVILFAAILATTIAFWPRSMAAGILILPYLGWVGFASVLNFTIWRLNG